MLAYVVKLMLFHLQHSEWLRIFEMYIIFLGDRQMTHSQKVSTTHCFDGISGHLYVEAFSCLALKYNWTQHIYINIYMHSKIKRANCFYRSTIISFIWRASVCRFIAHIEMNMLRLRRLLKVCVCTLVIWICCKIELHSQYTRVN